MKQKYRKYSNLEFWYVIGFRQEIFTLNQHIRESRSIQRYKHKIKLFHGVFEDAFGFIDVRQFKRTLNNSKYFKKKFMKGGHRKW